jgi:hypothetical protein
MALIRLKDSVRVPKVVVIACAVANTANAHNLPDMLITSGNDSQHMAGSRHYTDEALDFRTRHLTAEQKSILVQFVKLRLGPDYDVVLESDHLHIEYDPK